jgi:hypothetical protein
MIGVIMILRGTGTVASFLLLLLFAGTLLSIPLIIIALRFLEKAVQELKAKPPKNFWRVLASKVLPSSEPVRQWSLMNGRGWSAKGKKEGLRPHVSST